MNELYFVNKYGLLIGDRLVRNKFIFSKHHGIFVGWHNNNYWVAENQNGKGVQYVTLSEFLINNPNSIDRVERFKGNEYQRNNIINRINKLIGTEYDLINFNCEHFAEYVQNGASKSYQVGNALVAVCVIAIGYSFISRNK